MNVTIVLPPETARAVEDARRILARMSDAGLDVDEHGLSLQLTIDSLDEIVDMIRRGQDPHSRKVESLAAMIGKYGQPSRDVA